MSDIRVKIALAKLEKELELFRAATLVSDKPRYFLLWNLYPVLFELNKGSNPLSIKYEIAFEGGNIETIITGYNNKLGGYFNASNLYYSDTSAGVISKAEELLKSTSLTSGLIEFAKREGIKLPKKRLQEFYESEIEERKKANELDYLRCEEGIVERNKTIAELTAEINKLDSEDQ